MKIYWKINTTENKPNRPHYERIIKRENGRTEQPHRHHRYDCFATNLKIVSAACRDTHLSFTFVCKRRQVMCIFVHSLEGLCWGSAASRIDRDLATSKHYCERKEKTETPTRTYSDSAPSLAFCRRLLAVSYAQFSRGRSCQRSHRSCLLFSCRAK